MKYIKKYNVKKTTTTEIKPIFDLGEISLINKMSLNKYFPSRFSVTDPLSPPTLVLLLLLSWLRKVVQKIKYCCLEWAGRG